MNKNLVSRIDTSRLVLREPRVSDALSLFKSYTQDAEVARYMIWKPHTDVRETEVFIDACINAWRLGSRKPFVLALAANESNPIGMLDIQLHLSTVSIGYVLGRQHWGNGYMPEAIAALAEVLLSLPSIFRIQATCDIENKASARTLEKSGFTCEGTLNRYTVHPNISAEPRACFIYALCK